jgi:peptide/nickel transport system substrate-binding protein
MKSTKWILFASLLVTVSMILGACGPAPTPTQAPVATEPPATEPPATEAPTATEAPVTTPADTIIIGTTDTVASFDPADAYAVRDWEIIRNINEGLLKWKPGTGDELIPAMAVDMPEVSEDGLTYTFTLKDGIKFGDGTDLTAQIYADSMTRTLTIGPDCPNGVAGALVTPYLESVEAPDDKTIVFHLNQPVAYFLQLVASATYTVANPGNFAADECTLFPDAPVYGTGPWFVSQFTPDEQIVFEPNPHYTGDLKPQVSQVIVRFFSDPQTEALAIQNGEIDVAWRYLGGELIGQLKGVEGLNVGTINGGSIRYLILNHTMAPMDDPNVQKALALAVDRDEIADTVFGGEVLPIYSMVPPGFLGANEAFDTMYASPDLDAATELLAASGYTESNPLELELWYPPEHYGTQTAAWMEVLKKQFEATGAVQVTLQAQEWSTYVTACTGGEAYAGCVLGWFYDYPDASNYMEPFIFNGGQGTNISPAQEGTTYGAPINEKAQQLVDLMAQSDVETDLEARAALLEQAQEIYADLVVTIPLFLNPEYVVFRDNIQPSDQYATPETLNIGGTIEFNYSTLTKTP